MPADRACRYVFYVNILMSECGNCFIHPFSTGRADVFLLSRCGAGRLGQNGAVPCMSLGRREYGLAAHTVFRRRTGSRSDLMSQRGRKDLFAPAAVLRVRTGCRYGVMPKRFSKAFAAPGAFVRLCAGRLCGFMTECLAEGFSTTGAMAALRTARFYHRMLQRLFKHTPASGTIGWRGAGGKNDAVTFWFTSNSAAQITLHRFRAGRSLVPMSVRRRENQSADTANRWCVAGGWLHMMGLRRTDDVMAKRADAGHCAGRRKFHMRVVPGQIRAKEPRKQKKQCEKEKLAMSHGWSGFAFDWF